MAEVPENFRIQRINLRESGAATGSYELPLDGAHSSLIQSVVRDVIFERRRTVRLRGTVLFSQKDRAVPSGRIFEIEGTSRYPHQKFDFIKKKSFKYNKIRATHFYYYFFYSKLRNTSFVFENEDFLRAMREKISKIKQRCSKISKD